MHTHPPILTAIAILAIFAIVSGCGGGGDDGATAGGSGGADTTLSGETVPKAQFIKQADAICRKTGAQIQTSIQPYLNKGLKAVATPEVSGPMVEKIIAPELEAEIVAIVEIGRPDADAEDAEAFLVALQEAVDNGRDEPTELVVGRSPFKDSEQAAKTFGLQTCGGVF